MRSVADDLKAEDRRECERLTFAERLALVLRLGARDLRIFANAQVPPMSLEDARRELQRRRQAGRRHSKCMEEIIG